jgi:zinc protease
MKYSMLVVGILCSLLFACSPKTSEVLQDTESIEIPKLIDADPMAEAIPMDRRVVKGSLPSGMKYYIQENLKPENRAELRLAVKTGSIMEDPDQLGIAHFVEHMAFNGSENFEKNELVEYLETTGARFGPDLNAYTSFDETVYMLQVRTDSTELFDKGMLILRDWAFGLSFDEEEIDKERGVVISEWRTSLSPDQRIQQKTLPILLHGSRYAERLPIGKPEIIESASYESIKRFYTDWYRPDLMAIVVVGDIDADQVEVDLWNMFGMLPPVENKRERTEYSVPMHEETLFAIASDSEAAFTQVQLLYKHPETKEKSLSHFRKSMVHNLYNGMLNGRLAEKAKLPDPPFMYAGAGYGGFLGNLDSYSAFAMVPEGKALSAFEALLVENKRVLQHGFTESELQRQKKDMLEGAERSLKEMDKTDSRRLSSKYVYHFLEESPAPSPKQVYNMTAQFIEGISLDEVNALAKEWIRDESRVVVVTGPEKEDIPLPTEDQLKEVLINVESQEIAPYEDDVLDVPLFSKELSPVAIQNEKTYDISGILSFELENGVEVYLKQTDFKNDEILMGALSDGGTSLMTDEEYVSGSRATAIVRESGLGPFSNPQLDKWMAGKTVSVSPFIGSLSEGFRGYSAPKDLETMFQMIHLYFTDIREDEEAFTSFVTKQKATYKNLMSNPNYYFSDFSTKLKYNNHPRVGFPTEEELDAIQMDKAFALYRDRFADASDFAFYFVGNFEVAQLKEYAKAYLGNLPTTNRSEMWKDLGINVVPGKIEKRLKKGKAPKTQVQMYFHGPFEWTKKNSFVFNSSLDYLRIKLREALREDKGGVYGVRLSGGASKKPTQKYSITVSFNSDPERTDELVYEAKRVIKQGMEEGPNEEDLTKVKETQRQSRTKNLKENRFWQGQMRRQIDGEKNFDSISLEDLENQLTELTTGQIKDAIGTYFDYSSFIQIIMEPENEEINN